MMKTIKQTRCISLTIKYAVLILFAFVFLFPVFQLILKSFMGDSDIIEGKLFPTAFSFSAYAKAIDVKYLWWLKSTLLIGIINMVGITLSSSLCAYGFAKLKFKGREVCFSVAIATLMLPAICMQIPLYKLYYGLGWTNTWLPLIVPGFCGGGALNIFLMRQYMRGIPDSVCEAAKVDGANKFFIYAVIVMPMCLPIAGYVMLMSFLGCWNDFMTPLLYINQESLYNLSLGLYYRYVNNAGSIPPANIQMAAATVMLIPCMILFFFFQKILINGVTVGAVKG